MRIAAALLALIAVQPGFCHPGRLDSKGGHTVSDTGEYHIHTVPGAREVFEGKVIGVADGDTLTVLRDGREAKVRLDGIDAPEKGQPWCNVARKFVSDRCFGLVVSVRVMDIDQYGRLVAEVVLADGTMLNRAIVEAGLAWHYVEYSDDADLARAEADARIAGRGIWSDRSPVPPWQFRSGH